MWKRELDPFEVADFGLDMGVLSSIGMASVDPWFCRLYIAGGRYIPSAALAQRRASGMSADKGAGGMLGGDRVASLYPV